MQIKTDNSIGRVPPPPPSVGRTPDCMSRPDPADFHEMQRLHQALEESTDIRPDVVARARALAEQADYPPLEIIQRIGVLLARRLEEAPPSRTDSSS